MLLADVIRPDRGRGLYEAASNGSTGGAAKMVLVEVFHRGKSAEGHMAPELRYFTSVLPRAGDLIAAEMPDGGIRHYAVECITHRVEFLDDLNRGTEARVAVYVI